MEKAIEWLKRAPFGGGVEIELRPIVEFEDFGAEMTSELREQAERVQAQAARWRNPPSGRPEPQARKNQEGERG